MTARSQHLADISIWLAEGGPWGAAPEIVETHAAFVYLVGDRAFKRKKSVDLGYLDFSTPGFRFSALQAELNLNRRTAPGLYLGLRKIVTVPGGFGLDQEGDALDWLLEMRRFESRSLLSNAAAEGRLTPDHMDKLSAVIAGFHGRAMPTPRADWPKALAAIVEDNHHDMADAARAALPRLLDRERLEHALSTATLKTACGQLAQDGFTARHCHGDLHLGNIFEENGEPVLFDCLEFDDRLAQIPPLYDIAFLVMDLLTRGEAALANRVWNGWIARMADDALPARLGLMPLYVAIRAEIRAKVALRSPGQAERAEDYLKTALACLAPHPPRLIVVAGLSGTGKSTLARALAPLAGAPPGAVHLRSDDFRKRLAGVPPETRLSPDRYTQEATSAVYAALLASARSALESGTSVILDAVCSRLDERRAVATIAQSVGAPFQPLWLEAPQRARETRVAARVGDASDATAEVARQQSGYDVGTIDWMRIDAGGGPEHTLRAAKAALGLI